MLTLHNMVRSYKKYTGCKMGMVLGPFEVFREMWDYHKFTHFTENELNFISFSRRSLLDNFIAERNNEKWNEALANSGWNDVVKALIGNADVVVFHIDGLHFIPQYKVSETFVRMAYEVCSFMELTYIVESNMLDKCVFIKEFERIQLTPFEFEFVRRTMEGKERL